MADLEYQPVTLENYYELRAAIMQGAQSVSYSHPGGNKSVTYRSLDEMFRILRFLANELGLGRPVRGRTFASFSKGYTPNASCGAREEGGECHDRFNVDGRCCP